MIRDWLKYKLIRLINNHAYQVYRDTNDWWIGYYRGNRHHYVIVIPTIVIRWRRKAKKS